MVRVRSVAQRFAYEQVVLPFRRADLVYCPANFAPLFFSGPLVLTIHNPNYYGRGLELPEVAASRPWWKVKANHWAMKTSHHGRRNSGVDGRRGSARPSRGCGTFV